MHSRFSNRDLQLRYIEEEQDEGSVTNIIRQMQCGDESGADQLWKKFADRLQTLVKTRLHPRHRQVSDEEDVVSVSLEELFRGLLRGHYNELSNRSDFWKLLVTVASRNVYDQVNRENRQKRGGDKVRNETALSGVNGNQRTSLLEQVESNGMQPDVQLMMTEHVTNLLESLNDHELRTIAVEKAAGSTNQEVANRLGISLRSVERRLAEIRKLWSSSGLL